MSTESSVSRELLPNEPLLTHYQALKGSLEEKLTWGIEFEFLVGCAWTFIREQNDEHRNDPRWIFVMPPLGRISHFLPLLSNALKDTPLENEIEPHPEHSHGMEWQRTKHTLPEGHRIDTRHKKWLLMRETGLDMSNVYPGMRPIEVSTAVFHGYPRKTDHLEVFCREVRRNIQVAMTRHCGLHVHIGLGGDQIPSLVRRRLLTLAWFTEDMIFGLVAPYRRVNGRTGSGMTQKLRMHSCLGAKKRQWWENEMLGQFKYPETPAWKAFDEDDSDNFQGPAHIPASLRQTDPEAFELMRVLWSLADSHELDRRPSDLEVFTAGKMLWINMTYTYTRRGTVEFRAMQGTLDPTLARNWADFCAAFFELCCLIEGKVFRALIEKIIGGAKAYAIEDLLRDLGLEHHIEFWTRQRREYIELDDEYPHPVGRLMPPLPPLGDEDSRPKAYTGPGRVRLLTEAEAEAERAREEQFRNPGLNKGNDARHALWGRGGLQIANCPDSLGPYDPSSGASPPFELRATGRQVERRSRMVDAFDSSDDESPKRRPLKVVNIASNDRGSKRS